MNTVANSSFWMEYPDLHTISRFMVAKNLMLLVYWIPDCKFPTERELKLQVRGSITEFVVEYDGCELLNVSWKDNCPYVITTYNKHMGDVVLFTVWLEGL